LEEVLGVRVRVRVRVEGEPQYREFSAAAHCERLEPL